MVCELIILRGGAGRVMSEAAGTLREDFFELCLDPRGLDADSPEDELTDARRAPGLLRS